jgi:hypothetical protein
MKIYKVLALLFMSIIVGGPLNFELQRVKFQPKPNAKNTSIHIFISAIFGSNGCIKKLKKTLLELYNSVVCLG